MSADLLETIVAATRRIIAVREANEPLGALARRAEQRAPAAGRFRSAISRPGLLNVIAECKRRSPSKGVLRNHYDAASIAKAYASAGAAAVSVLTEPTFFDGSLDDLTAVREAVGVSLLRKDFIVSEYQLHEARAAGADAVLLIVSALQPGELQTLASRAAELGLDALVEVHDRTELDIAVDAGAGIIGINNRNLRTLHIDLRASESLIPHVPRGAVAISESGIRQPDDLLRLGAMGYHAFLIGERFMTDTDPGAALSSLLHGVAVR